MVASLSTKLRYIGDIVKLHLTPEQQLQLEALSQRQMRQLALVVEERTDAAEWAAENFFWLRWELIKYVDNEAGVRQLPDQKHGC